VKALVEESLHDLSLVNQVLPDDCVDAGRQSTGNIALERTAFIETRLKEAFQVLAVASRALAGEIKDRRMLDHQFAAIQEQETTSRHKVLHDVLTSMPNRILFNDRLEHELAQSLRHGRPLAVMFIDLDGFKDVNDRYGHDAGDAVLQMLAARLREHTRSGDTASRYGGDEFLYLLADPGNHQSMVSIAERMIRLIQEPCQIISHDTEVSISLGASIGISVSPKDGVTVDKLIKSADAAMYRAKQRKSGYSFALKARFCKH
jgi:diguanylate cyclase (GGDEF)-like protein